MAYLKEQFVLFKALYCLTDKCGCMHFNDFWFLLPPCVQGVGAVDPLGVRVRGGGVVRVAALWLAAPVMTNLPMGVELTHAQAAAVNLNTRCAVA